MPYRSLLIQTILVLSLLLPHVAKATVIVSPGVFSLSLTHDVAILEDAPLDLDITQVSTASWQTRFSQPTASGSALYLGQGPSVTWLRISLRALEGVERDWVLDIPYGSLTAIQWFVSDQDGVGFVSVSQNTPPLPNYRYHAQPVQLHPGLVTLYARIHSDGSLTLPLQLQTESDFLAQESYHLFLQAMYFGALAALLLYALMFAWSVKDYTYLIFSAYLLTSGFAIFVGNGLGRLFLWPQVMLPELALQSTAFALSGAFSLFLTGLFLRDSPLPAVLKGALRWLSWAYLVLAMSILISVVINFRTTALDELFSMVTLITSIVVLVTLWLARLSDRSQTYFFLAWVVVWLGALVAALRVIEWVPSNLFTLYVMQIATGGAALLFSLALFVRVRQQYQARVLAQQQALQARATLIETLKDTERKLEATVRQRTTQLQQSLDAEKRLREQYVRFGAMISHEFRNPLGVIETQSSLLQRELKAGIYNTDKRISSVRSAAQRLALLFEKWLQSDRLQNAMDRLQTQPIEFDTWFEDLVAKCHAYHVNHSIDCSLDGPVGTVHADERLLQIAVLNLIDNACKYSASSTTVYVNARTEGGNLRIDVTDEGVGIAKDLYAKVFDEYFRVDPSSPVLGVGLGLPFVRKIVTLHGGSVTACKNPAGAGTRFTIVVPMQPIQ